MYASIGASTGAFAAMSMIPDGGALLDGARLSLAGAGALFAVYALILIAIAIRSATAS